MQNRFSVQGILIQSALLLLLFFLLLSNSACGNRTKRSLENGTSVNIPEKINTDDYLDDIKARAFRNSDSTWGFTIYMNGKIYIHQPVMPGSKYTSGFQSEKDASKVAGLVVKKIKNHIAPEMVNENELDSLGIVKTNRKIK